MHIWSDDGYIMMMTLVAFMYISVIMMVIPIHMRGWVSLLEEMVTYAFH